MVQIVRESDDTLSREVWQFTVLDRELRFSHYRKETRPSKRHRTWKRVMGWGPGGAYGRCHRDLDFSLPVSVVREAVSKYLESITLTIVMAVPHEKSNLSPDRVKVNVETLAFLAPAQSHGSINRVLEEARERLEAQVDAAWAKRPDMKPSNMMEEA